MPESRKKATLAGAAIVPGRRLEPPPDLNTREQLDDWHAIVDALPHDWFKPENVPLIVELIRHMGQSRRLADGLEAMNAESDNDPVLLTQAAHLGKLNFLQGMHRRQTSQIMALMTKLRLTPYAVQQGNRDASNARKSTDNATVKPWEFTGTSNAGRSNHRVDRTTVFDTGGPIDRPAVPVGGMAKERNPRDLQ